MSTFPSNDPTYKTGYIMEGGKSVVTPVCRLSYCNLINPQKMTKDDGSPRLDANGQQQYEYNTAALFPPDADFTHMKALLVDVLTNGKQKFGTDPAAWPARFMGNPFYDQGEKKMEGYNPGSKYINVSAKDRKPEIIAADGKSRITSATQLYSGCYVRLIVTAYDFNKSGNKGIKFGLAGVQKIADGEPLGNTIRVEGAFKPVEAPPGSMPPTSGAAPASAAGLFQ